MLRTVSIVVPTYRERQIAAVLDELTAHLGRIPERAFEIVIVDDSPEEYRAPIRSWSDAHASLVPKVRVVLVPGEGRGKGGAVRRGAFASIGDAVLTMDADLPVDLALVERFLMLLDEGYDVVIAERPFTRNMCEPVRFVASRVLFAMQRYFIFQADRFRDTQCGFKAFRGDVIRSLARRQVVEGGMYDIEYLYMATREHRKVVRVPVTPRAETRPSTIDVWRSLLRDPRDLVRVKVHGLTGGYDREG